VPARCRAGLVGNEGYDNIIRTEGGLLPREAKGERCPALRDRADGDRAEQGELSSASTEVAPSIRRSASSSVAAKPGLGMSDRPVTAHGVRICEFPPAPDALAFPHLVLPVVTPNPHNWDSTTCRSRSLAFHL